MIKTGQSGDKSGITEFTLPHVRLRKSHILTRVKFVVLLLRDVCVPRTTKGSHAMATDKNGDVVLSEDDSHVLDFVFGKTRCEPETMSPGAKIKILQSLVKLGLKRDDRAFKTLERIASADGGISRLGKRVYDLGDEGLKYAPLVAYKEFPEPPLWRASNPSTPVPSEAISEHFLLQRPFKEEDKPFFWLLEVKWKLIVYEAEVESNASSWSAASRKMTPLMGDALGEALCKPAELGMQSKDMADPLRLAVRNLMRLSTRTLEMHGAVYTTASMRHGSLLKSAGLMNITF